MADTESHREIVSLRDYFDGRLAEVEKRYEQQRVFVERALDKAEQALGRRLDAMNEFREALKDQANNMATREQLDRVRDRVVEIEKRAAMSAAIWSVVVSIVVGLAVRWLIK